LPAAVLNDEATVTDATSAAIMQVVVDLTIPVWYNGTAWTKFGGGSGGSVGTWQKLLISTTVHLQAVV
jgi:hypothetical protein